MSNQKELLNYYNYKLREFNCRHCGWLGLGEKLVQGELFRECFEVCCPNCHECIKAIMYPSLEESRQNQPDVSPLDEMARKNFERKQKEYWEKKLRTPDQLPQVESGVFIAEWDQVEEEIVIRCGNEILFKEPAFFECYERFIEIAKIMKEKYGDKFWGMTPSERSWLDLYGDRIAAPSMLKNFHIELFGVPMMERPKIFDIEKWKAENLRKK